jgi:hypothetical protein
MGGGYLVDRPAPWRLDAKGAAMKRRAVLFVLLTLLFPICAQAHLGSPDVFFSGKVGPWQTRITIRVPTVVPGRAEILVQILDPEPLAVTFRPLFNRTAVSNAPPAESAEKVTGETNLYAGELWLMTSGAYSIDIHVRGKSGDGAVQIPVNSVATMQLPLPPWLGGVLVALALLLVGGGIAIVAAAAGESALLPGAVAGQRERRKYWIAATVTGLVMVVSLYGGKNWWDSEERNFRTRLREGGWPDLAARVNTQGSQRILELALGKPSFNSSTPPANFDLALDHGKLLHLFLVREPNHEAFAHIHPVREGNGTFQVALPPLPKGDYEMFCDLTQRNGLSSTATNLVHLPAIASGDSAGTLHPDPDDSWSADSAAAAKENSNGDTICRLPDGTQIIWKSHPLSRVKQNAALDFEVRDAAGQPAKLEPYMGMMSHAAVMRSDGRIFAHLHPTGNYSMAAQSIFDTRIAKETAGTNSDALPPGMMRMPDGTIMEEAMMHPASDAADSSSVTLPYEFPTPGDYRVWVQVKIAGKVVTGIFDSTVK